MSPAIYRMALLLVLGLLPLDMLWAQTGLPAISVTKGGGGSETYTLSIQVLALMTALTFIPAALMMMETLGGGLGN